MGEEGCHGWENPDRYGRDHARSYLSELKGMHYSCTPDPVPSVRVPSVRQLAVRRIWRVMRQAMKLRPPTMTARVKNWA